MISIIFTQASGITACNVPHIIFSIADHCSYHPNFTIYTDKSINDVIIFLQSNNFQFDLDQNNRIIYVTGILPTNVNPIIRQNINEVNQNNEIDENQEEEINEEEDEENNEEDEEEDEEGHEIYDHGPMSAYPTTEVTKDHLISIAANFVNGDGASVFSLYNSKVRELNKLFGSIVTLKRQVNDLMKVIDKQEIIKKISEDIEYLEKKCPIVDSIGFVKNEPEKLAIKTKEIITENQPKFGRRIVGRLQIIIDLRYLYNIIPPDNDFIKTFTIRNLDRTPNNWVCGHAFISNNRFDVCLGGYIDHIFEAITLRNLPLLFDTIIRFIKNPNEEDQWGKEISLFPKAPIYIETKDEVL